MRSVLIFLMLALPAGAAPTDEELVSFVRDRTRLERVTPEPFDMEPVVAARCSIDAILSPGPHYAASFHIHANEPAVLPIFDPWGKFPEGSLILKEKLGREDGETQLFTGMWKREKGYFPDCGDWEFFTVNAGATKVVERGKLANCASCHEDYPKGDFVTKLYAGPAQLSGGRIVLHASTAKVDGARLRYEPEQEKNCLGFWVNPADRASWTFDVTTPGQYKIHLWQGCGTDSGGSRVEVRCAGRSLTFTVEETGGFQEFKRREIGTLRFDAPGPQTLEIRALDKPGPAVMDLRQIVLEPHKP